MKDVHIVVKYFAIALAVAFIAGFISLFIYILGYFSNYKTEDVELEKPYVQNFDIEYKTLNIDLKTMNLNIKTGDNFKIESSKKNIVLKSDESKLSIKEDRNSTFLNIKNEIIVIYIPEHTLMDEVNINTGTGNITIDKLTSNFLELNTGTGKTKIGDLNILKKAKLDCGVGKLEILNSHINNLDMELGVGEVILNTKLTGDSKINSGVGSLNLNFIDSDTNYKILVDKGIGKIKINEKSIDDGTVYGNGSNFIKISGGIGNINLKFLQ